MPIRHIYRSEPPVPIITGSLLILSLVITWHGNCLLINNTLPISIRRKMMSDNRITIRGVVNAMEWDKDEETTRVAIFNY